MGKLVGYRFVSSSLSSFVSFCLAKTDMMKFLVSILFLLGFNSAGTLAIENNNNDPVLVGSGRRSPLNASDYFGSVGDNEEDRSIYLQWLQDTSYTKHTFLPMVTDPENGAAVFWKLYSVDGGTSPAVVSRNDDTTATTTTNSAYTHIQVAVAVRATGWVGFGISEAGGMLGSDIALFETANPSTIRDSYVVEDFDVPKEDDCQHWTLIDSTIDSGWLIVEMSRLLDTKDLQDHALMDDSQLPIATRLIAAWGDSPTASYHGFQVGKTSTTIFDNQADANNLNSTLARDFEEVMNEQADGYFEILAENYTIPANETTYHYVCKSFEELKEKFNLPETENGILTFVGGGAVLAPNTEPYVHHFIVFGSSNPNPTPEECTQGGDMLWGWAPGEEPKAMPDNIGISMFDPNGNLRSIGIEIHYNNPEILEGLVDTSGFRVYYSNQPRQIEAAWLTVGDPATLMAGQPIEEGLTNYTFTCASDCTDNVLGSDSVTVMIESLHMHKTGIRMTNELIRNGEVVNLGAVDVFEFQQQGSFNVQQERARFYLVIRSERRAITETERTLDFPLKRKCVSPFYFIIPPRESTSDHSEVSPGLAYMELIPCPLVKKILSFRR